MLGVTHALIYLMKTLELNNTNQIFTILEFLRSNVNSKDIKIDSCRYYTIKS